MAVPGTAVSGGAEDDAIVSGAGDDRLLGDAGEDGLNGDGRIEAADGGRDWLNGGAGDDALTEGAGDNMNGGQGRDGFGLDLADIAAGGAGGAGEPAGGAILEDFDPLQDEIVVLYDAASAPPELACAVGEDGATLFAGDLAVSFLPGAVEIDLAAVRLVAG